MLPTGEGMTVNGATEPLPPAHPLPPRPVRARQNDANRVRGIVGAPDDAMNGVVDMTTTEPWRD